MPYIDYKYRCFQKRNWTLSIMRYVSLHSGHDMNLSLFEDGVCIYHLELERLYGRKHYGLHWDNKESNGTHMHINLIPTLYDHALPAIGWKSYEIEAICVDTIQWMMSLYPDTNLRALLARLNYGCTAQRPADHGKGIWNGKEIQVCAVMHHMSHMAYSYFTSPFEDALIFAYDGLGEFDVNTTWAIGDKGKLKYRGDFTHRRPKGVENNSIGFLYTYIGNVLQFMYANTMDSPGKAMGLSAYGSPREEFRGPIRKYVRSYGRTWNDFKGIIPDTGIAYHDMTNSESQVARDFMATVQDESELYMLETIESLVKRTGRRNLCLGGGCALNVQINQRLLDEKIVDAIYVPPACSDTGNAIGNGLYFWHCVLNKPFVPKPYHSPYLGDYMINKTRIPTEHVETKHYHDFHNLLNVVAEHLENNKIIGWAQGRSEIGPRALGNRSILASPISPDMKDRINSNVKHRDYWRPFAPVCLAEHASEWFETNIEHPYMLMAPKVREEKKHLIPAVTHVDGTARLQTIRKEQNPKLYSLIKCFYKKTGVPILLNTSLNDRGKPICNDALTVINLLKNTGLDHAIIDQNFYSKKLEH